MYKKIIILDHFSIAPLTHPDRICIEFEISIYVNTFLQFFNFIYPFISSKYALRRKNLLVVTNRQNRVNIYFPIKFK